MLTNLNYLLLSFLILSLIAMGLLFGNTKNISALSALDVRNFGKRRGWHYLGDFLPNVLFDLPESTRKKVSLFLTGVNFRMYNFLYYFRDFELLGAGQSRRLRHILYCRTENVEKVIFLYSFMRNKGARKFRLRYYVALFRSQLIQFNTFGNTPFGLPDKFRCEISGSNIMIYFPAPNPNKEELSWFENKSSHAYRQILDAHLDNRPESSNSPSNSASENPIFFH